MASARRQRTSSSVVRVVLVHWNQPDRLRRTVDAFRASEGTDVRITVVDNASTIGPDRDVTDLPDVDVVQSGANLGFGPGANVGLRRFVDDPDDGPYVAVAPHDALPAPDCLPRIVAALDERPDAGLACADYGDGVTPVVDPYFGGIPAPATVTEGWEPAG